MAAASLVPDPSSHQQLGSALFAALPFEVRCRIYDYLLSFAHEDFADTLRPIHTYLDAAAPHATALPPLMLACKRAYGELGPRVHTTAALRVHLHGARSQRRVGIAAHGVCRFERLRRLVLVVDMEHANWNAWLGFLAGALARMPVLEKLVVDWAPRPSPPTAAAAAAAAARRDEKKEGEFLAAIRALPALRLVCLYGQVPDSWAETLRGAGVLTVKCYPHRWWKEPGFD
ncbi:hypothetical protein SAMD00023353_4700170 [Rosellinia necatrix]|uniref:Uncharacterized protein n=1 Tax=Rosellinia necatrix TaxID=77044 RepID=A0A1W2TQN2_ROSNE|nr:hypothetical protein SAMD00023353_4700170 [Rosellinia necatrix]